MLYCYFAKIKRCGVEQWQLVGLITQRSPVRVWAPLLEINHSSGSYGFSFNALL